MVWTGENRTAIENLALFASARVPALLRAQARAAVGAAVVGLVPARQVAAVIASSMDDLTGDDGRTVPARIIAPAILRAMLWDRELRTDLTVPFHSQTAWCRRREISGFDGSVTVAGSCGGAGSDSSSGWVRWWQCRTGRATASPTCRCVISPSVSAASNSSPGPAARLRARAEDETRPLPKRFARDQALLWRLQTGLKPGEPVTAGHRRRAEPATAHAGRTNHDACEDARADSTEERRASRKHLVDWRSERRRLERILQRHRTGGVRAFVDPRLLSPRRVQQADNLLDELAPSWKAAAQSPQRRSLP